MKKYGFLTLAAVIIGVIIYVTFVIALIKIALGLKIKKKAKDTF
jgi:hypothetical protein